jgi:phosphatidylserine/phosphatidylglycerophosphate/cardiolipin synthase-like enzyme
LKNAQQKVFIQTPTFTAKPVVEAVIAAVRRGITVILFVDVGFNDGGEALPGQGGTNEEVVKRLFKELKTDEEKGRLQYYWYTAKDQKKPINAHINHRNCHVKLMIADDHIGIQGNGNQDAQSWFHSQEINVMIDSKQICAEWKDLIRRNQNTLKVGRLDNDGIWRDEEENELTDSTGIKSGPSSIIKGVIGSINRVRGKGGF